MKRNNRKLNHGKPENKVFRDQPKKDSGSRRVNFDNTRMSRFKRDFEQALKEKRSTGNDFSWYNTNPQLAEAAGRLQFYNIVGQRTDVSYTRTPGICALTWSPAPGNFGNAVINNAAKDYYSFVVHANSRNTSYTAADLMIMTLAVGEVFSALALGCKVYGLMRQYTEQNLYTPGGLIMASGWDVTGAKDVMASYSRMWFDLNALIARANTLWIPNDMPFIQRRVWMNTNVYRDADDAKAQFYTFRPYTFYKYKGYTDRRGGTLEAITYQSTGDSIKRIKFTSWQDYLDQVTSMIDALLDDEDRGVMMGDILKAYGAERLVRFTEIPLDYVTVPTYEPGVLMQIENANIQMMGVPIGMRQDEDSIFWEYGPNHLIPGGWDLLKSDSTGIAPGLHMALLNVHQPENPSVEQVIEMTRLTTLGSVVQRLDKYNVPGCAPFKAGTEYLTGGSIWYMSDDNVSWPVEMPFMTNMFAFDSTKVARNALLLGSNELSSAGDWKRFITLYSAFDWAPTIYFPYRDMAFSGTFTTGSITMTEGKVLLNDLENYTTIVPDALGRLHDMCVYSEFGLGTRR